MLKIGTLDFDGYAALAPMAGVADSCFRSLCRSWGAAYTVGEMVSAKGIQMHDRKSGELLILSPDEHPAGIQLFGSEPDILAQSTYAALQYNPDFIDINMGCPAPKVTKTGAGSSLMKKPDIAEKIVKAAVEESTVPVTVKIRTGWDGESVNAVEMAKRIENAGAAAITVHGRTRAQMYAPPIDINTIRAVKQTVSIPVIGNGDITDVYSAAKMYEETNCDFIMIGRGALGKPWLFYQINAYLQNGTVLPEPSVTKRMQIMLHHAQMICDKHGEKHGICEVRKHALWYTKGLHGAAVYRRELSTLQSIEELEKYAAIIIKENQ